MCFKTRKGCLLWLTDLGGFIFSFSTNQRSLIFPNLISNLLVSFEKVLSLLDFY